jgi:6-pyruvoyltetrahydropterin/6-carboxytetrahydropterin synthase
MNASISRSTELAMGHRLRFHKGKCKNYHGHNYGLTFYVDGPVDTQTGMVVDFSELKGVMKAVLEPFDHAMCLHEDDELVSILNDLGSKVVAVPFEPTAENLAHYWTGLFQNAMVGFGFPHDEYTCSVNVCETSDTSTNAVE